MASCSALPRRWSSAFHAMERRGPLNTLAASLIDKEGGIAFDNIGRSKGFSRYVVLFSFWQGERGNWVESVSAALFR